MSMSALQKKLDDFKSIYQFGVNFKSNVEKDGTETITMYDRGGGHPLIVYSYNPLTDLKSYVSGLNEKYFQDTDSYLKVFGDLNKCYVSHVSRRGSWDYKKSHVTGGFGSTSPFVAKFELMGCVNDGSVKHLADKTRYVR